MLIEPSVRSSLLPVDPHDTRSPAPDAHEPLDSSSTDPMTACRERSMNANASPFARNSTGWLFLGARAPPAGVGARVPAPAVAGSRVRVALCLLPVRASRSGVG